MSPSSQHSIVCCAPCSGGRRRWARQAEPDLTGEARLTGEAHLTGEALPDGEAWPGRRPPGCRSPSCIIASRLPAGGRQSSIGMDAQISSEDSRLLHSIPPTRLALIERIAQAAARKGHRSLQQRFVRAYFRGVGEEDLAQRPPRALAKAALAHLEFGMRRRRGQRLVRVFNPDLQRDGFESPHTLVMLVTDDMPFLVDSMGIVFGRAEAAIHLIVHPVLDVRRDARGLIEDLGANGAQRVAAESWQLYEIDRQTDPRQLEQLQRRIA